MSTPFAFVTTDTLRAKDRHVAYRIEVAERVHLNVMTSGTVEIAAYKSHLWLVVRDDDETTQVMLPITREQLCDLACGLWIEEMAEADQ